MLWGLSLGHGIVQIVARLQLTADRERGCAMMPSTAGRAPFCAYPSRLQALVAIAAFLPLIAAGLVALPFGSGAPLWARVMGLVILVPVLLLLAGRIRAVFATQPSIELSEHGLLWRGWSETAIPWSAVASWQTRRYFGQDQATFWLHDPARYPATVNRLIHWGNKLLGFGDITLNAGGTNRDFTDLANALRQYAPPASPSRKP